MADVHHHHGGTGPTIVEEREGPAGVLGVLAIAALIGFLIWLFAFSGLVFNRNDAGTNSGPNVTVNDGDTEQQQQQPQQQPAPGSSS